VDNPERFKNILKGIDMVSKELDMPAVYPIHPRSRKMMEKFGFSVNGSIKLIEPLDYLSFLKIEAGARLVLTDSGGVQEESCILGVPCVTLRDNTERQETVEVGANMLSGIDSDKIMESARSMLLKDNGWKNPSGMGKRRRGSEEWLRREVNRMNILITSIVDLKIPAQQTPSGGEVFIH